MSWILWALGTLGFGGTVLFCVAAPTTAAIAGAAIGKGLAAGLRRMLSSRIGCSVLAGAMVFVVTWYWRGDQVDDRWQAKWDAAKATAEKARKERDASIAEELDETYRPAIADLQALNLKLQKQVKDYAKRKPIPAGGSCRLGADALRMRQPLR